MKTFKLSALGAVAAIGLASAAAIAQPTAEQESSAEAPADQSGMMQENMAGMMAMMDNPDMREQMMEIMRNCNRMMQMKQENMSGE